VKPRASRSAQSTLGARHFCPKIMYEKINEMPEFFTLFLSEKLQNTRIFMKFARKVNKIFEFHMIFARKMPEFYVIIARKIFSRFFFGGGGLVLIFAVTPATTPVLKVASQRFRLVNVSSRSMYSAVYRWQQTVSYHVRSSVGQSIPSHVTTAPSITTLHSGA